MSLLRAMFQAPGTLMARLLKAEEFVDKYAEQAAYRMIVGRLNSSRLTWRAAARENMRGALVYRALEQELEGPVGARVRELIAENAKLIRTLPKTVAAHVAEELADRATKGERATADLPALIGHVARWRARLIARTETSKASTALTQARAENLGLEWYLWRTSVDKRVRQSHRRMTEVLVSWNDAPSPEELIGEKSTLGHYHAGNAPNCRCYPEPLLRLDQVRWPHKVYTGGAVRWLTLAQFRYLNGLEKGEILLAA